jgi:hypothetical protein
MDNDDPNLAPPRASNPTEALVERWWADHFPGSPVPRSPR